MAHETKDSVIKGVPGAPPVNQTRIASENKYKLYDIVRGFSTSPGAEFSISHTTEQTLAETVQRICMIYMDSRRGTTLESRTIYSFVKLFRTKYPAKYSDISDTALAKNALTFVRSSSQAAAIALKLIEWELAIWQKATGAYIKMEVPRERPNDGALVGSPTVGSDKVGFGARVSGFLRKHVQGNDGDQNIYYRVVFPRRDNLTINSAAGGDGIDAIQRKYMEYYYLTGVGGADTSTLTGNAAATKKIDIAQRIVQITGARIDFYTSTGRSRSLFQANTIDAHGNYVNRIQAPYLEVELDIARSHGGASLLERIYREIAALGNDLGKM